MLEKADVPTTLATGELDPGLIVSNDGAAAEGEEFIAAIAQHRHFRRETAELVA